MIKYDNVTVTFRGEILFENLSFEIPRNSKTLISAKSGFGKSTLFAMALGFYFPDKGEVFVDGEKVTNENVWGIRKKIAFVDQETSLPQGKVSEWFKYVASLKANQHLDFGKEKILAEFEKFELDAKIYDEEITNLSGGEKQRLALITALLLNRQIYFLDEPTSALDAKLKRKVTDCFLSLEGKTVVIISHDEIWKEIHEIKIFDMERKQWER